MASVPELFEILLPLLEPLFKQRVPVVLVGHSMGSWLAYALCLRMAERGWTPPVALVANCFPAPCTPPEALPWAWSGRADALAIQSDGTFSEEGKRELMSWATPADAFDAHAIKTWLPTYAARRTAHSRRRLLPLLPHASLDLRRYTADQVLLDSFQLVDPANPPRLPFPIIVTWASHDEAVSRESAMLWERLSDEVELLTMEQDGADHLFLKHPELRQTWMARVGQLLHHFLAVGKTGLP